MNQDVYLQYAIERTVFWYLPIRARSSVFGWMGQQFDDAFCAPEMGWALDKAEHPLSVFTRDISLGLIGLTFCVQVLP